MVGLWKATDPKLSLIQNTSAQRESNDQSFNYMKVSPYSVNNILPLFL